MISLSIAYLMMRFDRKFILFLEIFSTKLIAYFLEIYKLEVVDDTM